MTLNTQQNGLVVPAIGWFYLIAKREATPHSLRNTLQLNFRDALFDLYILYHNKSHTGEGWVKYLPTVATPQTTNSLCSPGCIINFDAFFNVTIGIYNPLDKNNVTFSANWAEDR